MNAYEFITEDQFLITIWAPDYATALKIYKGELSQSQVLASME